MPRKYLLLFIAFVVSAVGAYWFFGPRQSASIPDNIAEVDWRLLAELDPTGRAATPESLGQHNGKFVKVPGFMVPLEDNMKKVTQFLLVPSPQACIHVPPPPPNQMLLIEMSEGAEVAFGPIWVYGILEIKDHKHMYGTSSFGMKAVKIEEYR